MSTHTVQEFFSKVESDAELQAKADVILQKSGQQVAEELAELSQQAGTPVSVEEISEALRRKGEELSTSELESVAGGVGFFQGLLTKRRVQTQGVETRNNSV